MYKELYYICEAFFGRAEMSYEEWLNAVEELVQRRVEEEVISWRKPTIDWWKNKEK